MQHASYLCNPFSHHTYLFEHVFLHRQGKTLVLVFLKSSKFKQEARLASVRIFQWQSWSECSADIYRLFTFPVFVCHTGCLPIKTNARKSEVLVEMNPDIQPVSHKVWPPTWKAKLKILSAGNLLHAREIGSTFGVSGHMRRSYGSILRRECMNCQ